MASQLSLIQKQLEQRKLKEALSAACYSTEIGETGSTVIADSAEGFSLECLLKATHASNTAALISRVSYDFPTRMAVSSGEAMRYAKSINRLLQYSQVFVMQNIDGDRRYALRMDTLLTEPHKRENITQFLDNITLDIKVLMQYFQNHATRQLVATGQSTRR